MYGGAEDVIWASPRREPWWRREPEGGHPGLFKSAARAPELLRQDFPPDLPSPDLSSQIAPLPQTTLPARLLIMVNFKRVVNWLAPEAETDQDGRDKWPSRTAFVLAAMVRKTPRLTSRGGCSTG